MERGRDALRLDLEAGSPGNPGTAKQAGRHWSSLCPPGLSLPIRGTRGRATGQDKTASGKRRRPNNANTFLSDVPASRSARTRGRRPPLFGLYSCARIFTRPSVRPTAQAGGRAGRPRCKLVNWDWGGRVGPPHPPTGKWPLPLTLARRGEAGRPLRTQRRFVRIKSRFSTPVWLLLLLLLLLSYI